MKQSIPSAAYLKSFLLNIYPCQKPFELLVINKKPKTKMGVYITGKHRIRIYAPWICVTPLEEIAIHEYAHHIHETEQGGISGRRRNRAHGEIFWRIYFALRSEAMNKGLFNDELIEDIISQ